MTHFRAVIFDLDGTLIDSAPGLRLAAAEMMAERGLPAPDLATIISFIGRGVPTLVARCLDWAGADPDGQAPALSRFKAIYDADPMRGTTAYPSARETLIALHDRGLRLGLCTNKSETPARAILAALDLGPFDTVVGGDTLAVRKPDPEPLLHAARLLGVPPDAILYVGDSETDWLTAQAAQVAYAHVEGGYQTVPISNFMPRVRVPNLRSLLDFIVDPSP